MFIVKNIVALKTFLIILYLIFFPCQYFAFGSTVRLVPLAQDNISGSGLNYVLVGEDLGGLGSVEVTLRYPPGSYDDVHIVFDDALQTGSALSLMMRYKLVLLQPWPIPVYLVQYVLAL
jgi:hypothetical protein